MRIGIVTTWFERGAAYVSWQYRQALRMQGHEVFIFARGGEGYGRSGSQWDLPTVTWAHRTLAGGKTFRRPQFMRWLTTNKLDAVIFNEQTWLAPVLWARRHGVKTIAYVDYYTEATLDSFRIYDALLCNTKRHLSAFRWHPQAYYVPWGTDTELFRPADQDRTPQRSLLLFHSAGYNPYRKGTDLVLRSFSQMTSEANLIIHSQVGLTSSMPDLTELVQELTGTGRLEVIHEDVSAPGLYHLGDVYVYPSRLDGIGLTQVEALASGLALVVPDWPPMNEFVSEGSGRMVPVSKLWCRSDGYYWPQCEIEPRALAATLDELASAPDVVERMKREARRIAETKHNWLQNAQNVGAMIEQSAILPELPEFDELQKSEERRVWTDALLRSAVSIGRTILPRH